MLLWTFDIDFINFLLSTYFVKPFRKFDLTELSIAFKNEREKKRLRRIRDLLTVLLVYFIYNLIIDR